MITSQERWEFFRKLSPYFAKVVPARFIQKTSEFLPGVARVHNLAQGIYKPANSSHALSIASMLKNPYADRLEFNNDRSWFFLYSPKNEPLDSAVNASVFRCMRDAEPIVVIKQVSDKTHREGSRYKILGLGIVDDFDQRAHLFQIRELTIDAFQLRVDPSQVLSDDLIETALQLQALEDWTPFVAEDRAIYRVSKEKRDAAFRKIVLENYSNTCAVSKTRFAFREAVDAQAAHIISKEVRGTDDPRNGIALSHTAHWAFDQGIFSISDQYEILVHPKAKEANTQDFRLLDLDRKQIILPGDEDYFPHQEALSWHREEVFGKFLR